MPDVIAKEIETIAAEEGEVLDVFGASLIVKGNPAAHALFLGEHVVPPGYVAPLHLHAEENEVFYVLQGELTLLDGAGHCRLLRPGDTAHLPAGSRHGFRNDTTSPVRLLVMLRPGLDGLEMFRHFDRLARIAPAALTPPEIVAIGARYGVSIG